MAYITCLRSHGIGRRMDIKMKYTKRFFTIATASIFVVAVISTHLQSVLALTAEQKQVVNGNSLYFDIDKCPVASDGSSGGAGTTGDSDSTDLGGSADIQRATEDIFTYREINPSAIVLHWTGGGYSNPNQLIQTLRSRVEPPEYPRGRAVQLTVDTSGTAYQLSESLKTKPIQTVPGGEDGDWNLHSIGIEIESEATSISGAKAELLGNEVQYQKVLTLVRQLMSQFGIQNVANEAEFKGIFGHHEINSGNSDPSPEYMQKIRADLEGFDPGDGTGAGDDETSAGDCECSAGGGVGLEELDGHRIPATTGGAGFEESINASGQVPSGGSVSFSQYASKGQAYRDFYITMRWRYAKWAWSGASTDGPEDVGWYTQEEPRKVLVTNPETGKSIIAAVLEAGPAPWTGTPQGESTPHPYWEGYVDGTPPEYNGRVAGFPPTAVAALEMEQWTYGGPEAGGSGHELQYGWASDQNATPGPVGGGSGSSSIDGSSSSSSSSSGGCGGITGDTGPNPNVQSDPATECTGGPKPGTTELSEYIMDRWGARNLGIYNCRDVVGGSSLSLHAEGRAFDAGLLVSNADEKRRGDELFMWAIVNAANIGAQEIIWNHEIWTPSQGLHPYTGENPHTDHVHIGQNDAGAAGRTPFYTSGAGR